MSQLVSVKQYGPGDVDAMKANAARIRAQFRGNPPKQPAKPKPLIKKWQSNLAPCREIKIDFMHMMEARQIAEFKLKCAITIEPVKPIDRPIYGVYRHGETVSGEPTVQGIARFVAMHYGFTKEDMVSARRERQIVMPRHIAMYLAKLLTVRSLPEIGRQFGNRDHTTVLYAVLKIGMLIQTDEKLARHVAEFAQKIRDGDKMAVTA